MFAYTDSVIGFIQTHCYNNNNIYELQLGCHPLAVVSPGGSGKTQWQWY